MKKRGKWDSMEREDVQKKEKKEALVGYPTWG